MQDFKDLLVEPNCIHTIGLDFQDLKGEEEYLNDYTIVFRKKNIRKALEDCQKFLDSKSREDYVELVEGNIYNIKNQL